jgi:hypothetical protein
MHIAFCVVVAATDGEVDRKGCRERPYPFAGWLHMPMEFLHGRPLSPEELEMIRRQIEEGFEVIGAVDDEIRGIVARNWPHLLAKLPPEED